MSGALFARQAQDKSPQTPTEKSSTPVRHLHHTTTPVHIPVYAQAWGNEPPPWLRLAPSRPTITSPEPAIQLTQDDSTTALQQQDSVSSASTSQDHTTERIKAASTGGHLLEEHTQQTLEQGLGIDLSAVRVHTDPAADSLARSFHALAFTTGTDIFFRTGRYHPSSSQGLGLLAHEATHVMQQVRGDVQPTQFKDEAAINDDQGLEREADMMAARISEGGSESRSNNEEGTDIASPASKGSITHSSRIYPLQMKLSKLASDEVDSPAGAIKRQLGNIAVNVLSLPGSQPAGQEERARKVEAIVDKTTIRDKEREKSANLSKVTTMARAEQFILQGADIKKFFDAGHLVGDQLVGGKEDTFQLWNLAPQASVFNSPVYLQIMEEEIRAAAAGSKVKVEVTVDYPDGGVYKVTLAALIKRGIVPATPIPNSNSVVVNKKTFPIATSVSIPRRIPNKWAIAATVATPPTVPPTPPRTFPATEKFSGSEELAHFGDITKQTPTLGRPFYFTVYNAAIANQALRLPAAPQRLLAATQWTPSTTGVALEDVVSLVSKTFPDLGNKDAILNKLKGEGNVLIPEQEIQLTFAAAGFVMNRLMMAIKSMTQILDPSLIKDLIVGYEQKIKKQLAMATEAVKVSPPNLAEALSNILTAQSFIEDMIEEFENKREEQQEQFLFPLSTHVAIEKAFQEIFTQVLPQPSSDLTITSLPQPTYPYPGKEKDFRERPGVQKGRVTEDGAEIFFMSFGPPAKPGDFILTGDGVVTVTKVFVEHEFGATMPNGVWHIVYKYGLHQLF